MSLTRPAPSTSTSTAAPTPSAATSSAPDTAAFADDDVVWHPRQRTVPAGGDPQRKGDPHVGPHHATPDADAKAFPLLVTKVAELLGESGSPAEALCSVPVVTRAL